MFVSYYVVEDVWFFGDEFEIWCLMKFVNEKDFIDVNIVIGLYCVVILSE